LYVQALSDPVRWSQRQFDNNLTADRVPPAITLRELMLSFRHLRPLCSACVNYALTSVHVPMSRLLARSEYHIVAAIRTISIAIIND